MNRYASGVGSDGYEIFVHVTMFCFFLSVYEIFFFFSSRRRHTRLQGDWISDVCSSDLLVAVRPRGAATADRLWPAALTYGRLIAGLPFVRMVAITGSLAWHNVDAEADIDYLIVTAPDRLWVCRWLIVALGRAAQLDGVKLCINYLISTRALGFAHRNLYTAYEVARMTPIAGLGMYRRLRRANPWVEAYLPNAVNLPRAPERDASDS